MLPPVPTRSPVPGGPSRHSRGRHSQRRDCRTTTLGFAKLAVPRLPIGIQVDLCLLRGLHGTAGRSCLRTREEWLPPLDINANQLAGTLRVDRQKVYNTVNGKRGVFASGSRVGRYASPLLARTPGAIRPGNHPDGRWGADRERSPAPCDFFHHTNAARLTLKIAAVTVEVAGKRSQQTKSAADPSPSRSAQLPTRRPEITLTERLQLHSRILRSPGPCSAIVGSPSTSSGTHPSFLGSSLAIRPRDCASGVVARDSSLLGTWPQK